MSRIYVIDVPCSECRVGTGEQCVRSNGRPFSRVTGMTDRPYQYHQPRRLLYNTVKAQVLLGLTASA